MKYLGIDLGTANTYVYGMGKNYANPPAPVIVPGMSDASGSISTVVLYEKNRPLAAGNAAEAEYYSQPGLRANRGLASQFKPEIGVGDPGALRAAADFLRLLRENLPDGTIGQDTVVTVGTPSLAREDYRVNLAECFVKAGWPRPDFRRESDAALVSCLQAGSLSVNDLDRKSLILDFGGGTCDYTTAEKLDVLQSGGDILYGGRLFDDLFYLAFCRENPDFAREIPASPFAWHARWLECRAQKERFSDFIAAGGGEGGISLRIVWHNARGESREAFLRDYTRDRFLRDAENYRASPELLDLLAPYARRGGLSAHARDLLAGREIGLITWMRAIFESVEKRRETARAILTGGSSRWFFVSELAGELFAGARLAPSSRGYEDIAFGLALFPVLAAAQKRASALLADQAGDFARGLAKKAKALVEKQGNEIADLCAERIVDRDVMPELEAASRQAMTAAELEKKFAANIANDSELAKIAEKRSEVLRSELEDHLNYSFRAWLSKNGVPLAPQFDFPAAAIGRDFFKSVSVKISRLDALNLAAFTLRKVVPALAAAVTGLAIAHGGEPVSAALGGGAAYGAAWLLSRVAPRFMEQRKLPAFILNESNRKKIAAKNREYIGGELRRSFSEIEAGLSREMERKIHDSLEAMLASLSALNQVKTD